MSRHEFRLPDVGEGLTEAEVVQWHVEVGSPVGVDDVIVEIETDKAVVEIPSPVAGTLLGQGAPPGGTLEVGEVLAVFEIDGEPAVDRAQPASVPDEEPAPRARESPARQASPDTGVRALPMVRRLAEELGVDLAQVRGSGKGGIIERDDVEAAAVHRRGERPSGEGTRMSPIRRAIARRMESSWREIPQLTAFASVDVTRLVAARDALSARHGSPVSMTAMLCAAVAPLLVAYRDFNATLEDDRLVHHREVDLGVAVATPDGLVVPVLRDAVGLGVLETSEELARLERLARERKLAPADMSSSTFVVSNVGAAGGAWGHGTPLVPPGNTAIVAAGRIDFQPAVVGDEVVPRRLLPLSLSFDHRVIDGAPARTFLSELAANLEEPALFLAEKSPRHADSRRD